MADQLAKLASSNQFNAGRKITLLSAAKSAINSEEEEKRLAEEVLVGDDPSNLDNPYSPVSCKGNPPGGPERSKKAKIESCTIRVDRRGLIQKRVFVSDAQMLESR
ncbi:UNVERIFIED_CONTAM: hypothetical protein Sradi_2137500 [Sesamum radiatum]|uniref:Uncharacterized protein n=1 Tax=Sesamum radiatum TaxID=300843 RepID=A0AAW2TK69_SESRA